MEENVVYKNIESKNYNRSFANISYITQSLNDDIAIDFYEEYMDTLSILDNDANKDDNTIFVTREKKVSLIMSKSEAIYMAKRIIERLEDDEQNQHEGDEE